MTNVETITQKHREAAANLLSGESPVITKVREDILAGLSDDHPTVQAAAFYDQSGAPSIESLLNAGDKAGDLWPPNIHSTYALTTRLVCTVEDLDSARRVAVVAKTMPRHLAFRNDVIKMLYAGIVVRLTDKGFNQQEIAGVLSNVEEFIR